ncbi:exported hypothetical protein [uncultured Paludibacter sp.]|nr:exported hypothetical protein [uncultured Paludibacter sp.]
MKKSILFLVFFVPFFTFSQVSESFSDGNFTENPLWNGIIDNFIVNSSFQLQSKAASASKSYLTTPSEAFENASWETWIKITYNPSSSNYVSVYIISDRADISTECFGYYVQIGNTNDEVSLYLQEGTKKTKIIDGRDKILDSNPAEVKIKVTRDKDGNFNLYSKLPSENDYVLEGTVNDKTILGSKYFGLFYSNTSTTGNDYFFDDISVSGDKFIDIIPPVWTNLETVGTNQLKLTFSETMDFSNALFTVDNEFGNPSNKQISTDGTSILLTFGQDFEKGKIYTLTVESATDLSGNPLENTQKQIAIIENPEIGDVVINEICFEAAENSEEYFEVYNNSDKVIDLSKLIFTTRKTDGNLNTGYAFSKIKMFAPKEYFAFSPNADSIKNVYTPPTGANIFTSSKWYSLNNSNGNLIVTNTAKDTIYDEIKYDVKWHHPLIKSTKGVSLEKINPTLSGTDKNSWHSASSEVHYGTPGYKNSQYREMDTENSEEKWIWAEPESFSPDNDGINDVCFFRYKTDENGFVANAVIFNAVGVKMKQLAQNQLLSSEGFLMWDGTNDKGKIVNPSVYVLYIEIINSEKGIKKSKKLPVVVSIR